MIAQLGRFLPIIIMMMALAACGSSPSMPDRPAASPGERAAAVAVDQVGVRYRYGGNSPQGFDCSGLVHYAYRQAGLSVPRTTGQLWALARDVNRSDLRAGDLLFFRIDGKMSHVGIYLGERQFVHAPQSGRTVSVESLDTPFYSNALLRAGRIY